MKLKNVGFLQQHVEKIVLGAAGLFLLVAVVLFVLRDPYSVELPGAREKVPPGEVEAFIASKADELQAELDRPLQEELPEVPPISNAFARTLQEETLPGTRLATIYGQPLRAADVDPPTSPDKPYHVPRPPLAQNIQVHADHAVLADPAQVNNRGHDQVVELIGLENQPFDFPYASASAMFDLGQWRSRLQADPDSSEHRKLDPVLAANRVSVTGVYLQRQERDPLTGEWGNTTIVRPLPTQIGFVADQAVEWQGEQARGAMQWLRDNQQLVQQPEFVALAKGRWVPPHQAPPQLGPAEVRELHDINQDIQDEQKAIGRLEDRMRRRPSEAMRNQLDRLLGELRELQSRRRNLLGLDPVDREQQGGWEEDQWGPMEEQDGETWRRGNRQQPRETRGSSGRDGTRTGRRYQSQNPQDRRAAPSQPANPQLPRDANDPRQTDNTPDVPPWLQAERDGQQPEAAVRERVNQRVRVWAHDLTVERGKTYRYRVIVSVLNPLFQHRRNVPDAQVREYVNKIALGPDEQTLAEGNWSEPVQIDPEHYFFLVGGSTANEQAEIEIWRIYDGQWRHGTFRLRPGDPITGTTTVELDTGTQELDLNANALFIDLMAAGGGGMGGRDTRMLYFDERHSRMADRTVDQDSEHPDRLRLQNEVMLLESELMQARLNDGAFRR